MKEINDNSIVPHKYEPTSEAETVEINKLFVSCLSNLANCYQQVGQWKNAIEACDAVLEIDPMNAKALYRRAQVIHLVLTTLTLFIFISIQFQY